MGYTPNLNDRNSPYYYGVDSTYKPASRKPKPQRRAAVASPLLTNDPQLQGYNLGSTSAPTTPQVGTPPARRPGAAAMPSLPANYAKTERAAGQTAENYRDGAGFPGQSNNTGRGTPAPNGGSGSGTQTSPRQMTMDEANELLKGGYTVKNPFASNSLPETNTSPYFHQGETPQYRSDAPADMYDVQLARDLTDGSPFNTGDYQYEVPANTNIEYLQQEGSPIIPVSGQQTATKPVEPNKKEGDDKNSGINWGARTAADNSDPNIARRRAFLDAPGSMVGLRRVEAEKGIVYAGGKHHMVNPNQGQEGQSDFIAINKSDRDAYMRGDQGAQDLKNKYVKDVKEATVQIPDMTEAPSDYQMTPGVDVKTAGSQRPAIQPDTSKLTEEVVYETPKPKFRGGRNAYQ